MENELTGENPIYHWSKVLVVEKNIKNQEDYYKQLDDFFLDTLKKKNDSLIHDAIALSKEEHNIDAANLIKIMINDKVNTYYYEDENGRRCRSDIFIIPFILVTSELPLVLPSLKSIETLWREHLLNGVIIESYEEFNLSPLIIGQKTSQNMGISRWYEIHTASALHLKKRDARTMYANEFSINLALNQPVLSFFVATINRPDTNAKPIFLDHSQAATQNLEFALDLINDDLNEMTPNAAWSLMTPSTVSDGLPWAYQEYQEQQVEIFINYYAKINEPIYFVLLTLDYDNTFAVVAWKEDTNNALDIVIMEPFAKTLQDNSSFVMNLLQSHEVSKVYIGSSPISLEDVNPLSKFDFMHYKNINGVDILEADESIVQE